MDADHRGGLGRNPGENALPGVRQRQMLTFLAGFLMNAWDFGANQQDLLYLALITARTAVEHIPRAIQQAVAAGVKCIEHGHLIDEPTARLLAEKGIWWSLQPFLNDQDASPLENPVSRQKALQVFAGTDNAYRLAKKYKVKTAFGTDILFDAKLTRRQGAQLAKLIRWYTPAEALKMATGDNGELLALSGIVNPYPGKLGVIEEGALADLVLVDGNPLENIQL